LQTFGPPLGELRAKSFKFGMGRLEETFFFVAGNYHGTVHHSPTFKLGVLEYEILIVSELREQSWSYVLTVVDFHSRFFLTSLANP
jgi:hypothetical protein